MNLKGVELRLGLYTEGVLGQIGKLSCISKRFNRRLDQIGTNEQNPVKEENFLAKKIGYIVVTRSSTVGLIKSV